MISLMNTVMSDTKKYSMQSSEGLCARGRFNRIRQVAPMCTPI